MLSFEVPEKSREKRFKSKLLAPIKWQNEPLRIGHNGWGEEIGGREVMKKQ